MFSPFSSWACYSNSRNLVTITRLHLQRTRGLHHGKWKMPHHGMEKGYEKGAALGMPLGRALEVERHLPWVATEMGDHALPPSEPKPTVGVYEYRFATGALAVTNAAERAHWPPPFRRFTRNRQAFRP